MKNHQLSWWILIVDRSGETNVIEQVMEGQSGEPQTESEPLKTVRQMTKKELFEELYGEYIDLPTRERHFKVMDGMEPYFDTVEELKWYVDLGFDRKARNMRERRIRMIRKAYLAGINYFCTFTYDDKKHTEESFRKGLQTCLRNLCYRKQWKYMGVWERSPQMQRLHFHGLFAIPENKMVGMLFEKTDFSLKTLGQEDKKLLLFDDFNCWDEGIYMGRANLTGLQKVTRKVHKVT